MKNILLSLNESEKKRILGMHNNQTKSSLFESVENKTVQLDCAAKTINGILITQANLYLNLCPANKTTTDKTLAQQYKMVDRTQIILTPAELSSIGATSAEVLLDSNNRVQGITFKMKNVKSLPANQGGGQASPTYSTVSGNGRVAGQVSQVAQYEQEQPGVTKLMQSLGKKQAEASNSFK
jgi:hypothetical protein